MITIGYSTRFPNPSLQEYFKKTSGLKDVEVIEKINNGEKSLSQVYNEIINESSNDILVLCHDDIKLETGWAKNLIQDFKNNPDFSIIGKAGSCYFPESGVYWEKLQQTMVGQVYHHPDGQKKWLSKYSPKLPFLIPVVTIDGLFISFDKRKIKHGFDEKIGRFHFYDHAFCIPNFLENVKIGVTSSFEITHQSIGQPNQEFWETKEKFLNKWNSILPLDLKPTEPFVIQTKSKETKLKNKIAVIIPTDGNNKTLIDVIDSFFEHCNSNTFDIFVVNFGEKDIPIIENVTYLESKVKRLNFIFDDVIKREIMNGYEYVFFGRDNIKVCNDVLSNILKVFKEFAHTASVSCRTHYSDNIVKYDGVFTKENQLVVKNKENYYNFSNSKQEVDGNSSLMTMYRKDTLLNNGSFDQSDIRGVSDIDFTLRMKNKRFKNFVDGFSVAKVIGDDIKKIKILTGFSEKGGSTFAFINLTNAFNELGYDCTLYGPHGWHLDKCKSDLIMNLRFEKDDVIISHFLDLQNRPEVKKIILSCHEKDLFKVGKIKQHWDEVVFLNQEHRNYHNDYNNKWSIIPNLTQNLKKIEKSNLDKVAGIIGSFDFNKQTHLSIQRAIDDGCENVYLFGEPNTPYFEQYVKPLCNDKVVVKGFFENKQEMYDMIGRVYNSSLSEVASLVKDECELTGTKFFGTNSTSHNNHIIPNDEVIKNWIKILEL
jgi:hypothetical protein